MQLKTLEFDSGASQNGQADIIEFDFPLQIWCYEGVQFSRLFFFSRLRLILKPTAVQIELGE
jgi:hypothetical protein